MAVFRSHQVVRKSIPVRSSTDVPCFDRALVPPVRTMPIFRLLLVGLWLFVASPAFGGLHIGMIDPQAPADATVRNAAAQLFARSCGEVRRIRPDASGGWNSGDKRIYAPEEFDVLWFHQGDDPAAVTLPGAVLIDLEAYLEGGGVLLLSGAAGSLLNDLQIESTPLRILGPTDLPYPSGIVIAPKHRGHPAFEGLNASEPVLTTTLGGNALADFHGTPGPHGELLADGNAGLGERPLVEYAVGTGCVVFVGWRLPDFTSVSDPHRANLERLFSNLLRYLAKRNLNRARLIAPSGESQYVRLLGVPFLRVKSSADIKSPAPAPDERSAVSLAAEPTKSDCTSANDLALCEQPIGKDAIAVHALALTLTTRSNLASHYRKTRQASQEAEQRKEQEQLKSLRVITPEVRLLPAPLKPLQNPRVEQSVLLGRSPFMAPEDGKGDIQPAYEPIEDGGFRITDSRRRFNRMIVQGQNRVLTGDAPVFRMDTGTGNYSYSADRIYPLWPRPDAQAGVAQPCMGTLRLAIPVPNTPPKWLDEAAHIRTTFRPGYTRYEISDSDKTWKASVLIAPALDGHGMICRVSFDKPTPLLWRFGGIWWLESEQNTNRCEIEAATARFTEPNLPNGLVLAGWDGQGAGKTVAAATGQEAEFVTQTPQRDYHIVVVWGVTVHDVDLAQKMMTRLDTPAAAAWPAVRDHLKRAWFRCFVQEAMSPQERFNAAMAAPSESLERTRQAWDHRREQFQIRTPDPHLTALINWERCRSEYHRKGPGLYLGEAWQMYSHISTGWYGKQWGGDHQAAGDCLRLYGAMQADDGFIRWVSPTLVAFLAENNTPYWVDQVWWHYAWTADLQFVRDLWPAIRKAVEWQRKNNDPDEDGLFQDWYEYWNGDSNGKGPKAAAPSAMSWAMLDRAARLAEAVEDRKSAQEYRDAADKTRREINRQLWTEDAGRLGSIGADDIWRGHPQIWEEYLAINAGLLTPEQGRRAMRWLESHYGFEPVPGIRLLSCSDWFPIRWSVQWVPTGDTCLAVLAGMKSGDVDLWWPYLKTVVGSAFKSDFPGINMGISNPGAGGGDREDVDSVDPHVHMAVRGLFGIEPALHENRIDICPAFPWSWTEADIRTPDFSYEYRRKGSQATFRIRTPQPRVKRVRANLAGPQVVTPSETESLVTVALGPATTLPGPPDHPPTILAEQQPPSTAEQGEPLRPHERTRQVIFDLTAAYNITSEEMTAIKFIYDYDGGPGIPNVWMGNPHPIAGWWGNPVLKRAPGPRVLAVDNGVLFLTAGRTRQVSASPLKNLLALSSWRPYPLPAGAVVPVGMHCERLWLLLQGYVHPMKNYIPNGEVVLVYDDGHRIIESLIPPFNLDCYFQHFSRRGIPVSLGHLGPSGFIHGGMLSAHADALEIRCDPDRRLQSVELRATCSEGLIGLVGMTALQAPER